MATDNKQHFRHFLKEWRELRRLTQDELGHMVGTSKSVISRYESGNRRLSLEMQFKLMRALKIEPAQFFSSPDAPSLDALMAGQSPEARRRVVNVVRAFLTNVETE